MANRASAYRPANGSSALAASAALLIEWTPCERGYRDATLEATPRVHDEHRRQELV